jgi:nucleoside-diphosphate-sugar epimerase
MTVAVLGAGGFIGSHLVKFLKGEGKYVVGVDIKLPSFGPTQADEFIQGDLGNPVFTKDVIMKLRDKEVTEIYQLAADMGGAGYIFTGLNDANVMTNSSRVNLNLLSSMVESGLVGEKSPNVFYSSSACIYPEEIQKSSENVDLREESAYPANPDSEYGWEKLFSERLFASYRRNFGIKSHIARYHNVFGPEGTFDGGKEKAPAAICRKVAQAKDREYVEIWGDGKQTRSFLFVKDCVEATVKLTRSDFFDPINIGSEEMVSINTLAELAIEISGKNLGIKHIQGPQGVRGRNSNNSLIEAVLNWRPSTNLRSGLTQTYEWIARQVM